MVSAAFFGVASRGHQELDYSESTFSRQKIVKILFLETPIVSELLRMKLFPKFSAEDYVRSSRSMQIYLRLELFRTKRETIY